MEKDKATSIDKTIGNIIKLRKEKGFSLENMANELAISVAAYHKIEKLESKLTVERLLQIIEILNSSVAEIFNVQTENIYHQQIKDQGIGHQQIENLYQDNQVITQKLIETMRNEIDFLKTLIKK